MVEVSKNKDSGNIRQELETYEPKNKIRLVTATSLFDGHDASINIMRRLLQARGCEVIHLGHNRSAGEIAHAALQEDVHGIAISSYQGGHVEFFKYIREILDENHGKDIKIFGGGGGVITPNEIKDLESVGITKIYSPEDGQTLGLAGIIGHMIRECDKKIDEPVSSASWQRELSRKLTLIENASSSALQLSEVNHKQHVLGITGTGGAGKSSLTDELLMRMVVDNPKIKIGILCIDPSKKKTGGALLGDRIRVNSAIYTDNIFLRSFATRDSGVELSSITKEALQCMQSHELDLIIVETSGIGQGNTGILDVCDSSLYVMTAEYGAATQLEKIDMLDFADFVAINKFERPASLDAIRDVRTTMRRSRYKGVHRDAYPVYGTIASRFNDDGVNALYSDLLSHINTKAELGFNIDKTRPCSVESTQRESLIPASRQNYLYEIAETIQKYHENVEEQANAAHILQSLNVASEYAGVDLEQKSEEAASQLSDELKTHLQNWPEIQKNYGSQSFTYKVRGKDVVIEPRFKTLSHLDLPKVSLPSYKSHFELAKFFLKENVPGSFPYTAGVFPFRRKGEDPKRQFAGEGGPVRTNTRFHFLTKNDSFKRLSTAFDSVTLYGSQPHSRPDIYGKVGESGVSIATLQDMRDLYSGFDLTDPSTSVSMTINGPAPIILAMYMNAAVDQQVDAFEKQNKKKPNPDELNKIFEKTIQVVRGTVQADILKEDQAQNTCIFSTEFALKMMGDVQEYFIKNKVKNYYSVSISGYHIAEAGANPITQLAFTLANGFTYVEYYRSRGMHIDEISQNLSFFFSNGIDAEYAVLGRVARRIWAIALRDVYGAGDRAQKLKYHIQTSGRSLHAQEIDFNDIRTTLQALLALYDNCNSLHTNAYDEAITTPTEESVRRAMAIQLIINKEFGPNNCENINQGSYFLTELTDLVEAAVCEEFKRISLRGGVLGAMETQYQRSRIQEESLYYESLKDSGELPIVGVNTYQNPQVLSGEYVRPEIDLIRASYEEKDDQLNRLKTFKGQQSDQAKQALDELTACVVSGDNIFAQLLKTVRHASLGDISEALYRVGGRYRRNM